MIDKHKLKAQANAFFDSYKEFESVDIAQSFNNERVLVVVVDMVKGFCSEGALSSENCGSIAKGISDLIKKLPKAGFAFVRDAHEKDCAEFSSFPPHCIIDSTESELVDELKGFAGIDVPKNSTNAYFALSQAIPDFFVKYDQFLLVGVCTDICVMQLALTLKTAINEFNLKNEVTVVAPLTNTFDMGEGHPSDFMNAVSLKLMQSSGVKVVQLAQKEN